MTPEEKAKEIIIKYKNILPRMDYQVLHTTAKDCSIVHVDELINSYSQYTGMYDQEFFDSEKVYWQKVKEAIQNL